MVKRILKIQREQKQHNSYDVPEKQQWAVPVYLYVYIHAHICVCCVPLPGIPRSSIKKYFYLHIQTIVSC